jgi:pimeloyl-ACP methyl ester carboxylesterase
MNMSTLYRIVFILVGCVLTVSANAEIEPYLLSEVWLDQPVDHNQPEGEKFEQQVFLLEPEGVGPGARVFFALGGEGDATREALLGLYEDYGNPENMVFILAEHRGYGQSISRDDQTKPEYVTVDQALRDYHRVVEHFKGKFGGQWIAAGYSYSAALVINFAHDFPEDTDVILASSAPIRWPFLIPGYGQQVQDNLGSGLSKRLASHIKNLKPEHPYDKTWKKRERLTAFVVGLSQYEATRGLLPYVNALSYLPTGLFTSALEFLDRQGASDGWVDGRVPGVMSYDKAYTGLWNWHTWKYQQCTEVGTFFFGAPFDYMEEEIVADCKRSFDESPKFFENDGWNVSRMIDQVSVPQVFVVGGMDPWAHLGVRPDHQHTDIDYIYDPDGFHCPDREDKELAARVMSALLARLTEQPIKSS